MPFLVRPEKTLAEIVAEWDAIAPIRLKQIVSGSDPTFTYITSPSVFRLLDGERHTSLLDAGCGVGVLTDMLASSYESVIGVDPSSASINLARNVFGQKAKFETSTLESFVEHKKRKFDAVVANMVLMDVVNLESFLKSAAKVLKRGGVFVFTTVHPCFWPEYYGYSKEAWFDYNKELIIESPFRISNHSDCRLVSTHFHRPLEQYVMALERAGLLLEVLSEPFPTPDIQKLYPKPWRFPRYLVGRCRLPRRLGAAF
jgi:2-polyprenyl-3-methyl-5-hydroxy-6-metoxy-1,4-benzoquinol methylase